MSKNPPRTNTTSGTPAATGPAAPGEDNHTTTMTDETIVTATTTTQQSTFITPKKTDHEHTPTKEPSPPPEDNQIQGGGGKSTVSLTVPQPSCHNDKASDVQVAKDDKQHDDDDEEEEAWELTKVFAPREVLGTGTSSSTQTKVVMCDTPGCPYKAAVLYTAVVGKPNTAPKHPPQEWYGCLDCQDVEFGGWPEDDEMNKFCLTDEHKKILQAECSSHKTKDDQGATNPSNSQGLSLLSSPNSTVDITAVPPAEGQASTATNDDDDEPTWELIKVLDEAQIVGSCPISCSSEDCRLKAAVVYVSSASIREKWYSCLDCQDNDFGGWPDEEEMQQHVIRPSHAKALRMHCSTNPMVEIPVLSLPTTNLTSPVPTITKKGSKSNVSHLVTPVVAEQEVNMPAKVTNKAAIEMHKKWLQQASAYDPNARLVVDKTKAKSLVFDMLLDAFTPMNITQIHTALKAVVPSPVLKTCLDDMSFDGGTTKGMFDDSDGEEESNGGKKNQKSRGKKSSVLVFKPGRTAANSLYYVDYHKTSNQGNGLPPFEKNALVAAIGRVDHEKKALQHDIGEKRNVTSKLLGEPTNDQLSLLLETENAELDKWVEKTTVAREYQANIPRKQFIKRRINSMCSEWRKRRRMCLDFLTNMEEMTDGSISRSKCLAGDDKHIEIESDEYAVKNALAFASKKTSRNKKAKLETVPSTSTFIGVRLNSQGCVERVFSEE